MTTAPPAPLGAIVLDTNVISELMRGAPDARVQNWVRAVPPDLMLTTSITLAEVRFGIARLPAGRRRALLGDAADEVFDTFASRVLPFDAAAASAYADIVVEREQAGEPIAGFDAQIAATCRIHRAALATRNISNFTRLGLDLIDPWLGDT